MSRDIQWTDTDPATGGRRYVTVEKFAGRWAFKVKLHRRDEWRRLDTASRDMWETLLEALERRYQRREGVSDEDLAAVRKVIAGLAPPPAFDGPED
jgi:hypothetical protein